MGQPTQSNKLYRKVKHRARPNLSKFVVYITRFPPPDSRASEFRGKWLNSNLPEFLWVYTHTSRKLGGPLGFRPALPPWDIVTVSGPKGSYRVGMLGLLTSDRGIYLSISIYLSIYLYIYTYFHIYLSIYRSISIYLSIYRDRLGAQGIVPGAWIADERARWVV